MNALRAKKLALTKQEKRVTDSLISVQEKIKFASLNGELSTAWYTDCPKQLDLVINELQPLGYKLVKQECLLGFRINISWE